MKKINVLIEILKLKKVNIEIIDDDVSGEVKDLYCSFNKPHPKFKIFKNKSLGVELFKIPNSIDEYEKMISGKNSVGYFSRRCSKMGYYCKYFTQKDYLNEINQINTSTTERQGRKMSDAYLNSTKEEPLKASVGYFGVFNSDNKLVGYTRIILTENLIVIAKILGHKDYLNDNIMYLLLHDLIVEFIKENKCGIFFMYDTYFGASEGLKLYKRRHQFTPYKVKWKYIDRRN